MLERLVSASRGFYVSRLLDSLVSGWAVAFAVYGAFWIAAATSQSIAKGQANEPIHELDKDTIPPRVIKQVEPKYTGSRGFRVQGTVALRVVVNSQGLPGEVQIIKSLDPEVDQSAVEALKQWRFEPAKRNGKSIAVRVAVTIRFQTM